MPEHTYFDDEADDLEPVFANLTPGSALRAGVRDRTCPTCREPNRLTAEDAWLGYHCDECAERREGRPS